MMEEAMEQPPRRQTTQSNLSLHWPAASTASPARLLRGALGGCGVDLLTRAGSY